VYGTIAPVSVTHRILLAVVDGTRQRGNHTLGDAHRSIQGAGLRPVHPHIFSVRW
jgi:hypothetical protein